MDKIDPNQFPRRILLAVTGLSPQVVTETLYALAVGAERPWVPTEVHLITTGEGARRAELSLLSDAPGWFHRFCRDYGLDNIAFDVSNLHVLTDDSDTPLDDIRTLEHNEKAADSITKLVSHFTSDDGCALHVSIAGGRKTMGFYLGYALSLYGRAQDRLSHVLVSEPFESSWNFFYPTPYPQVIEIRDKSLADTREAVVTLAEIPFVRLRHGVDERLRSGTTSFSEAVASAERSLRPPRLVVDIAAKRIVAGDTTVSLPPGELAFYSLFARRAQKCEPPLAAPAKGVPDKAWGQRFLREYRKIWSEANDSNDRTVQALGKGMDGEYFSEKKSALHRRLKAALGAEASRYLIDNGNKRPGQYHLPIESQFIEYRQ